MDSGVEQTSAFNEAVSFAVACKDQAEIDYFWEKLSAVKASEQCGWCKDRWGVSWQITPRALTAAVTDPDPAAAKRARPNAADALTDWLPEPAKVRLRAPDNPRRVSEPPSKPTGSGT